jgi:adenylate cyclase
MGIEIERKFLVHMELWNAVAKPVGRMFRQGYLVKNPRKTIRVRLTDSTAYLTIKGPTVGTTRQEFEYEIPRNEAEQLLEQFAISELQKIRYNIMYKEKLWEVDVFLGDNLGLIIAEIELNSESEPFNLPPWIDREVTGEKKYYNSNLAKRPFLRW